jgi:hypothetical protein
MQRYPYEFQCLRCDGETVLPDFDRPAAAGCAIGGDHDWRREVDPRRYAAHEAAHAIAAAVLLGVQSVRVVRLERPSESDTVFVAMPNTPQSMIVSLSGPVASERVGDGKDGTASDLKSFRREMFSLLVRAKSEPDGRDQLAWAIVLSKSTWAMQAAFEAAVNDFVDRWEPSIDHFATALLEKRRLEGPDLVIALNEALAVEPAGPFVSPVLDPGYPLEVWLGAGG